MTLLLLAHSSKKKLFSHANLRNNLTALYGGGRNFIFVFILFVSIGVKAQGQQTDTAYLRTITERSAKIVNTLAIKDQSVYQNVLQALVNQYALINKMHDETKASVAAIKTSSLSKEEADAAIKNTEEKGSESLAKIHREFIGELSKYLTASQVEQIKDGMTYRILPITYAAYQDEIPALTTEQKAKIYSWLVEARELAMDAESSEKKHAVFGKYKGRINNYLSAEGYDMKKEGEAWQQRIKEREAKKNAPSN